jgi:hypothetical protein
LLPKSPHLNTFMSSPKSSHVWLAGPSARRLSPVRPRVCNPWASRGPEAHLEKPRLPKTPHVKLARELHQVSSAPTSGLQRVWRQRLYPLTEHPNDPHATAHTHSQRPLKGLTRTPISTHTKSPKLLIYKGIYRPKGLKGFEGLKTLKPVTNFLWLRDSIKTWETLGALTKRLSS